jgi:hypothetical protein
MAKVPLAGTGWIPDGDGPLGTMLSAGNSGRKSLEWRRYVLIVEARWSMESAIQHRMRAD